MATEQIPELTPEQKEIVLQSYKKLSIPEIVTLVSNGAEKDARSPIGRAIKSFLAGEGKKPAPLSLPQPSNPVLTEEQKKMIVEMAPRVRRDGGSLELARIVWNDQTLTQLHKQSRAVFAYMKEVYPEGINMSEEPVEEIQWQPPSTMSSLVGLINTFIQQSDNSKTYNLNTIKPQERKCLETMMISMRSFKFKCAASKYEKQVDRDLFLSTFIGWTHDKPDITEIERSQFILAAEEMVNIAQIDRSLQRIDKMHEEVAMGQVYDDNGKRVKLGMADVELINSVRTKHDAAKKRLESNMKVLETARSERLKGRQEKYTSIWDLIEPWMRDEEQRNKWIDAGIQEKADDAAEVERLSGLEEMIAIISGQTKEEAKR